ncbi:sensor histidine kinase [Clostridium sp. OM05-9]|jgi:signal transduction histidine kinase|uniref:HAMP domain-containing sensor histidine kinase n=1 Tax=Clostridium sp. OM05-9 TaxID=2293045 RepID=UPI000E48BDB6|nr:HAMP domain-containing sensor histidine kinase [Clostridium sp. OM05-9]RHV13986.1 sensor histidine kinase [Clostridium sp. OM05-9]
MKDRETRQKNRREKRTDEKLTLNTKLILVIAGSLLLAVGLFFVWLKTTVYIIDKNYLNETATARRTEEKIDRFSDYVRDNKVKSTDMNAILRWQQEEGSVYLLVYQNENVIYDSTKQKRRTAMERFFNKITNGNQKGRKLAESEEDKKQMLNNIKNKHLMEIYKKKAEDQKQKTKDMEQKQPLQDVEYSETIPIDELERTDVTGQTGSYVFYSVRFEDGLYDVCIVDYSEKRVYYFWMTIGFLVCSFIFMMFVMIYNGRVVKRVRRLTREVSRIKKNDINAAITKSGHDEIYVLADNIDSMRNSIIQQMSKEKEAWQANRDLVTAMAHDIRTPLTVLKGYLDLLETSEFDSEEEYKQYVDICVDKAGQLKDLSDKLFRYFFVYSGHTDELKMEKFPAKEFFQQMIGEYMCLLEEKGITFQVKTENNSPKIQIDAPHLKRLFDNIFTNIRKYSDYSKPVEIQYSTSDTKVTLVISNHISKNRNEAESTRIGIKTCEKIAQEMNIDFSVKEKKGQYTVTLVFAIVE